MHGHLICARASPVRDVPYDARMMHRDALMRLMHLGLGDAWCIKPRRLITPTRALWAGPHDHPLHYAGFLAGSTSLRGVGPGHDNVPWTAKGLRLPKVIE